MHFTVLDRKTQKRRSAGLGLPCAPTKRNQLRTILDQLVVTTGGNGQFCFTVQRGRAGESYEATFGGDEYHGKSRHEAQVDNRDAALEMRFVPPPRFLSLDQKKQTVWVETRMTQASNKPTQLNVVLELREKGNTQRLGSEALLAGERAQFTLKREQLGKPGPAKLVARFAGNAELRPSERSVNILKTARATLILVNADLGKHAGDPINLDIAVEGQGTPAGAVEVMDGDLSLGTAAIQARKASFQGALADPTDKPRQLSVRFLGSAPWWLAGRGLSIDVPYRKPSPWRRLPWFVAALGLASFAAFSWRRPGRKKTADRPRSGSAGVQLVAKARKDSGWRGVVVDAHDGTPIAGAELELRAPTFTGNAAARGESDAQGRFQLPHVDSLEGSLLWISSAHHASLSQPLPPPGQLNIQLVARRRSIQERLVAWAKRRGHPYYRDSHEPTPGEVSNVAENQHDEPVKTWANAVERAAFGPEAPSEATAEELAAQEPMTSRGALTAKTPHLYIAASSHDHSAHRPRFRRSPCRGLLFVFEQAPPGPASGVRARSQTQGAGEKEKSAHQRGQGKAK